MLTQGEKQTVTPLHSLSDTIREMKRLIESYHEDMRFSQSMSLQQVHDYLKFQVPYVRDGILGSIRGLSEEKFNAEVLQRPAITLQRGGDCLPQDTLLLSSDFRFVPIQNLRTNDRIWGYNRWSIIGDVWYKGTLPVDAIKLNNGSWFKATGDHKVYVKRGDNVERIRVSELEEGVEVLTPERIEFGTEDLEPSRAYIEGLYIADGWCSHDYDFSIAGKDGHPKELQKQEVETLCTEMNIPTRRHSRYVTVKDSDWASRIHQMGGHSTEKHALSINLKEDAARELLRGIMADSGRNTHGNGSTFTTTSETLARQVRVLHKMCGVNCGATFIQDHGGLGKHPIWRLFVRSKDRVYAEKKLRVKRIERNVAELPVYDISTDDHYVYLPEADVTVSNCDDKVIAAASYLTLRKIPYVIVTTSYNQSHEMEHVYLHIWYGGAWQPFDVTMKAVNIFQELPYINVKK